VLKTIGYMVSSISVLMLGIVSWGSASEKPLLLACLIAGMLTSVIGMCLRWISFLNDRKDKAALHQVATARSPTRVADMKLNPRRASEKAEA
jgi:hypothetical protein